MNTLTHVAAGGLVCQAVLFVDAKFGSRLPTRWRPWLWAVAGLILGAASHLWLDALPHYNWVVYMKWLNGLPYHWLIRNALFGLVVLVPLLYWGRDRWWLVGVTVVAAMYPDVEKVAYIDLGLPQQLVIFHRHSTVLSGNHGGLPHAWLIALEMSLLAGMMITAYLVSKSRLRASKEAL